MTLVPQWENLSLCRVAHDSVEDCWSILLLPDLITIAQFTCQRKVEMSGFPPDRNVRFHGLLQGCSAGTWYLDLLWFLGFGVRSASPGGRRPEGLVERCAGSGQARRCRYRPR